MAEPRDIHARSMVRHLRRRGAEARRISLQDCGFDTKRGQTLLLSGFGRHLPDAVLVRTIAAGSFEAVTHRLGVLHALRETGVLVWNDARSIERCVDKAATSFLLARAGIPTPDTWSMENEAAARRVIDRELRNGPLVLKPLFGSQGRGIRLLADPAGMPCPEEVAGVYYLQRYMAAAGGGFRDYRVFVVAGRVVAAMIREGSSWITNVKRGGKPRAIALTPELEQLALAAAACVGAAFCGVDILPTVEGPMVLEVNSMPAWAGLQKVTALDISGEIAGALLEALHGVQVRSAFG